MSENGERNNSRKGARLAEGIWRECKLGEAPIEIIDGDRGKKYPSTSELMDTGYCIFLSTKNVRVDGFDFSCCQYISKERDLLLRKGRIEINDLVLTTRGTVGNIGYCNDSVLFENIRINSGMVIIRPNVAKLFPSFNYYLFRKLQNDFKMYTSGSAQPQLPIKDLKEMDILLPPLPEQYAIASMLCSLDDKIDLLYRENKTLEEMAKALFKQWFMESSGKIATVADIIDFAPSRSLNKGVPAPYLEMSNVNSDSSLVAGWYEREFSSGTKFMNGDTLLARITPCLENGKACYVSFLIEDQIGWGSTEFIVMRPKERYHPLLAYALVKNEHFRDFAEGCLEGSSGRQRVNVDHLSGFEITMPKDKVVAEFNATMNAIDPKLSQNGIQIRTLVKLRDTLLPKLMSGEVRVAI